MKGTRFNPTDDYIGSVIPEWLDRRPELGGDQKRIYARLRRFAGRNGKAWPSYGLLARELSISLRSVFRGIKILEACGLIEVVRRGGGSRITNLIYFLDHPWRHCAPVPQEHRHKRAETPAAPQTENGCQVDTVSRSERCQSDVPIGPSECQSDNWKDDKSGAKKLSTSHPNDPHQEESHREEGHFSSGALTRARNNSPASYYLTPETDQNQYTNPPRRRRLSSSRHDIARIAAAICDEIDREQTIKSHAAAVEFLTVLVAFVDGLELETVDDDAERKDYRLARDYCELILVRLIAKERRSAGKPFAFADLKNEPSQYIAMLGFERAAQRMAMRIVDSERTSFMLKEGAAAFVIFFRQEGKTFSGLDCHFSDPPTKNRRDDIQIETAALERQKEDARNLVDSSLPPTRAEAKRVRAMIRELVATLGSKESKFGDS